LKSKELLIYPDGHVPRKRGPRELKQTSVQFLSRLDVAQLLGVCTATIIAMERSGQLTPYKFGGKLIRYRAVEVHGLVEKARAS
jgi:hypothetical protein